jgi:phosphate:Na+ symporter
MMIVIESLGGLGLFLLGMITMTDGLKLLAGDTMRRAMMIFTKSPLSGAITGALSTAILQSSSATTVAAVGFVGAGIISFSQALGIIFGANIGTTFTGWLVAILGFKLKLGTFMLPVIFLGVILRLIRKDNWSYVGMAMSGFGLVFIGISVMQEGMGGLPSIINPQDLPSGSLLANLKLVALGALATAITQSSSAGVAATMTALVAGAIDFEQAASLVIGMDVGTTITAALATIGGSVGAKRTGLSHVIYNIFTAAGALIFLSLYIKFINTLYPNLTTSDMGIVLVGFHSLFNILGVIIVLPFTHKFAKMIEHMIGASNILDKKLGESLLVQSELALSNVRDVLLYYAQVLFLEVENLLSQHKYKKINMSQIQDELNTVQIFLDKIEISEQESQRERLVSLLHTLDHLQRLHERCDEDALRARRAFGAIETKIASHKLISTLDSIKGLLEKKEWLEAQKVCDTLEKWTQEEEETIRTQVITKVASGVLDTYQATEIFESIRWMKRVSKHISHIVKYLNQELIASVKQ